MPTQYHSIQISDLPRETLSEIRENIRLYSVAMLSYDEDESIVIPSSGTLCRVRNNCGIITAKHVWDNPDPKYDPGIKNHRKLKIILGKGAYTLETSWLSATYPDTKGKKFKADIPDIAFVRIPSDLCSTFES